MNRYGKFTWIIMAVVTLLCICLVRNLSVERVSKKQLILETAVGGMNHFFEEIIGKEGKRYIPYLMSVGIYIGIANLIGLLGFKPPTKDMNVTAALAIMSIILIEYAGFHQKGLKKWVRALRSRCLLSHQSMSLRYLSSHCHCACVFSEMFWEHL